MFINILVDNKLNKYFPVCDNADLIEIYYYIDNFFYRIVF